jgi:hypothetical protein
MGFDFPIHLWFLTLIAPVVVFYFLKLRRQRMNVPSLLLWSRVLNDQRVNSPFQRFKRHLLLLLQILLLAALVLAASAPFIMGRASNAKRIPIIIDTSASMGAIAPSGGGSRLERVKKAVAEMIDGKKVETEFAIVSFAGTARSECGFTNNSRVLLNALDRIEVRDTPAKIDDAIRMVLAMAREHHFQEAELFSDGNFPPPNNVGLSFKLNYHKISDDAKNIGITSLSARRSGEKDWTVFVKVAGTKSDIPAILTFRRNGETIGEEPCSTGADASSKIEFSIPGQADSQIEIFLKPGTDDALASDNSAFLYLPKTRPLNVTVAPTLPAATIAAKGVDDTELLPWKEGAPPPAAADVAITDSPVPLEEEKVLAVFGAVRDDLKRIVEIKPKDETVIDWKKEAPVFRHANMAEISLLDGGAYIGDATEKDLENLGYEVVAYGDNGPLALKRDVEDAVEYYFLFHLNRSTLPYRVAFPIIIKNLCDIARDKTGLADIKGNRTGVLPDSYIKPNQKCVVIAPDGTESKEKSDVEGMLSGIPAPKAGKYKILSDGETVGDLGVALLSQAESSLDGIETIPFNEVAVMATTNKTSSTKTLWRYLAIAALLALFLEWWIFNQANRATGTRKKGNKNA